MRLPWRGADPTAVRARLLVPVALVVAILGHSAWYVAVDPSPDPFLPEETAQAKTAVTGVFPNATPPTVHVYLVAGEDGNVLSPDALTALAGMRNRISSDATVAPLLAPGAPLASSLSTLEPHLEGRPGEWNASQIDAALTTVMDAPRERRALASYLATDAKLTGGQARASAAALVVRLTATADPAALVDAQQRIQVLAEEATVGDLSVATDAPALRDQAARSAWNLWVPLGTLLLVPLGLAVAGARARRLPLWTLVLAGAAGAGLLAGWGLGHDTPASLAAAYLGSTLGVGILAIGAWLPEPIEPAWPWALPLAPLAAIAGWVPAGTGALAAVATVAALAALGAAALAPDLLSLAPRWSLDTGEGGPGERIEGPWGPAAVLGLALLLASLVGLPSASVAGWHGALPPGTEAGQAAEVVEERFGGTGPGAHLAIAAWGPAEEPGFLGALDATGQRLDQLTLAAGGSSVESVLSVARDWATNETRTEPGDRYDPVFARAWANATNEDGVPVRNVSVLVDRLDDLDPTATRAHLVRGVDGSQGVALLRQDVSVSGVVPRPLAAVEAALQPLVAASDQVSEGGSALDEARSRTTLEASQPLVVLATVTAALAAGALWMGRTRSAPGRGVLVGLLAGLAGVLALLAASLAGLPARPLVLAAAPATASMALLVALPTAWQALEDRPVAGGLRGGAHRVVPIALVLAGLWVAMVASPMDGIQAGGLSLTLGGLVVAVAVPLGLIGLLSEPAGEPAPRRDEEAPEVAHTRCPVCERTTATAANRCPGCGRWNLLEACPAHPEALEASCSVCGEPLGEPRFG